MAFTERLALIVDARTDGATRKLKELSGETAKSGEQADATTRRFKGLSTGLKVGIAVAAGVAGRALFRFAGDAVRAASDLEQAVGGTKAVFGDASGAIDQFGKRSAEAVGLSKAAFREATTLIGGQLKRMTGDIDFAADTSIKLVQVGADLAATYGGTTKEAVDAFAAALRGEADPAERFNLNLKIGAVNAKAVELGLARSTSEVDDAARAQALYALVVEQSADAQGQFAREGDTVAVTQQKLAAELENTKAEIGEELLPVQRDLLEAFRDTIPVIEGVGKSLAFIVSNDLTRIIALDLAALIFVGKGLVGLKNAMVAYGVATETAEAATRRLGLAMGALGLVGLVLEFKDLTNSTEDLNKGIAEFIELTIAAGGSNVDRQIEQVTKAIDDQGRAYGEAVQAHGLLSVEAKAEGLLLEELQKTLDELTHKREVDKKATDADAKAQEDAGAKTQAFEDDQLTLVDALDAVNKELDEQWQNLRRLNGELVDATESEIEFRDTLADGVERIKEATKEEGKRAKSLKLTNQFGRDNVSWLLEAITSANDHAESVLHETKSIDEANNALATDIDLLREAAKEAGLNADEVEALIDQYVKVPSKVDTKINQPNMTRSQQQTDNLRKKLQAVDRTWKASIVVGGISGALHNTQTLIDRLNRINGRHVSFTVQGVQVGSGISARQHGGPVEAGQPVIVGERRPEVFVPKTDGTILPRVPTGLKPGMSPTPTVDERVLARAVARAVNGATLVIDDRGRGRLVAREADLYARGG